jgi:hypothetical protein
LEVIAKARRGDRGDKNEQADALGNRKWLMTAFSSLDHRAVHGLIGKLKVHPDLPAESRDHLAEFFVEILTGTNPKEAIGLLQMLTDYPNRDYAINSAFSTWSAADPTDAFRWYEEETAHENPVTVIPGMLKAATLIRVRIDPASALSDEQIEKLAASPDEAVNLGGTIATSLRDAREHTAFLTALRRAEESGRSPLLAAIRADYVMGLSSQLHEWTFDEATALIESELTPSEKMAAVNNICPWMDLMEPERWADWFEKIESADGEIKPMTNFVLGWMHGADSASAGKWLEQASPGKGKDGLVFNYALLMADKDPPVAMQWVSRIQQEKLRTRAFKEVGKKWEIMDPSAAAAFAKDHDLPE